MRASKRRRDASVRSVTRARRCITVSDSVRSMVLACRDHPTLDQWFRRAATMKSATMKSAAVVRSWPRPLRSQHPAPTTPSALASSTIHHERRAIARERNAAATTVNGSLTATTRRAGDSTQIAASTSADGRGYHVALTRNGLPYAMVRRDCAYAMVRRDCAYAMVRRDCAYAMVRRDCAYAMVRRDCGSALWPPAPPVAVAGLTVFSRVPNSGTLALRLNGCEERPPRAEGAEQLTSCARAHDSRHSSP